MKKKLLTRTFGIMLSACLMISSVPVMASPVPFFGVENDAPTEEIVDDTEEISAEEIENEEADTELEETENETDAEAEEITEEDIEAETEEFSGSNIFELDWKNASDEKLEQVFSSVSDEDIAAWVSSLSEEEKAVLLEKDTRMNQTLDVYGFECDDCGITDGSQFETGLDYYTALASCKKMRGTFTNDKGLFYIEFVGHDEGRSKVEVSQIKNTLDISERQESLSWKVMNKHNDLDIKTNYENNWKLSSSGTTYYIATIRLSFKKPKGYSVSGMKTVARASVENTGKKFDCVSSVTRDGSVIIPGADYKGNSDSSAASEESFYIVADMIYNMNVGSASSGSNAMNAIGRFTFTPSTYNVSYNANGGSGAPGTQSCTYDETYTIGAAPTTAAAYKVNINTNGGEGSSDSISAKRDFVAWSDGKDDISILKNLTAENKGNVTLYARWSDTGYYTTPNNPVRNCTVSFKSNGGTEVADSIVNTPFSKWTDSHGYTIGQAKADTTITANYSAGNLVLPSSSKTGYNLDGWSANGGTTKKAGEQMAITADTVLNAKWTANKYKIKLNAVEGVFEEPENEKEPNVANLNATYDEIVSLPIPARTGYTFKQWKDFAGNVYVPTEGSDTVNVMNLTAVNDMEVNLVAEWEAKKDTKYTVKYLFKEKDEKEYSSKDFAPDEVREGTSDASITVAAKVFDKYVTPEDQNVTIDAEGTTVVTFYYVKSDNGMEDVKKDLEDIKNRLPGTDIDTTDLINRLNEIKSIAELNKGDWDMVKQILQAVIGLDPDMAAKLADIIKSSSSLSEQDKLEILKAISNGYLTDEMRSKLIKAIQNAILSEQDKATLIEYLNSISNLTLEQQNQIKQLIEKGSSVSYTVNGVTYEIHKNQDGTLSILIKSLNGQTHVVIPDQVIIAGKAYPITEIGKDAFKNNQDVQSVQMGNNITKIGESAFEGCKNLKSVIIGPNVTEIGDKAFKDCISLTSISIPGSVKTIGNYAFYNCKKMSKVTFHEGLLQIGKKAFAKCVSIKSITIPKSVIKIKSWCFQSCTKMTTFKFKAGSLLVTMSDGVFADCKVLKSIKLPSKLKSIPAKTFRNCYKLTKCTQGVNVTEIGNNAFENCKKLRSFTVQSKVQKIKTKAFYNCKSLKKLSIRSRALTTVGSSALKRTNKALKISCPTDKISAYSSLFKGKY